MSLNSKIKKLFREGKIMRISISVSFCVVACSIDDVIVIHISFQKEFNTIEQLHNQISGTKIVRHNGYT